MFAFQVHPRWHGLQAVSRLCWTSLASGVTAAGLFLLPLVLVRIYGYREAAWGALLLAWVGACGFGVLAVGAGFLSQWRLRPGERYSMVFAVLGGALGLATLFLGLCCVAGLLLHLAASH